MPSAGCCAVLSQLQECISNCIKHLGNSDDVVSDEIKVCKGTVAYQAQSMINHASELLSEVGMQVCNMLFSICHTLQKAGEEFLVPRKDFFITTEDPDNIKGLLIKGPNRHKLLPFSVACRMAGRELHNLLTFASNGDQ